jgi:16S rRNA (cytidine1402-2'-O)-methyltransferase
MAEVLGPRDAAVTRELTKLFEEVRRGTLPELADYYHRAGAPKGEVTIVITPPLPLAPVAEAEVERLLGEALTRLSPRDAAADVATATGLPRRCIYARAVALKGGGR